MKSQEFEDLISVDDVCHALGLKKSYVYMLTHERRIPHYKVNGHLRFRLSDIEQWLKRNYCRPEGNKVVEI